MENEKLVARWESRSGKHWVELHSAVYPHGYVAWYRSPNAGGVLDRGSDDAAIREMQRRVDSGYFQPDAAKTPMKRVK